MKSICLCIMFVSFLGISGCSTVHIDWDMATSINTIEAYDEFLRKHPDSEFTAQALKKVEPMRYQKALDLGTSTGFSTYLLKYPKGVYAKKVRSKLRSIRCADPDLAREEVPSWLKMGDAADPLHRTSWYLDKSYIGVAPSDIGRGYKAACDDPDYPLDLAWEPGVIVYFSGRGVIVGPDGTTVLVGYECK
ncbi:MAG TPA: hypothetical protein PLV84_05375 [Deltaproteobacteria bacterium]|nr:hypothetical protein [Deltaproteobacteria bacterium]